MGGGSGAAHHDDDLGVRPDAVDTLDQTLVMLDIGLLGDVVGSIGVVRAEVDDDEIGLLLLAKVPGLGFIFLVGYIRTC